MTIQSRMSLQRGKKLIAASKLQSKIKCVASVIFAIFCSRKNTFCSGEVWQQLTEHNQWGFQSLYCNIKWLSICKYKHMAGNKHLSQPVVSSLVLIKFLHLKQRKQQIYNFVRKEDSQTLALSWFMVHLFPSTGQHTNTFCYDFGFQRAFRKGNNVYYCF